MASEPVEDGALLLPTLNSRRSYAALWALDLLLLVVGAVLLLIQNVIVDSTVPDESGTYPSTAVFVGGWGAAGLGTGVITLLVLLFLNAFTGGPLFVRERSGTAGNREG